MKQRIRYTDEPMEFGGRVPDFLPPPDKLIFKDDAVKVTITLSSRSVQFFKEEAAKRGVQYQRMIRRLLDVYVDAFSPGTESHVPADRVEQPRGAYRATTMRAMKQARSAKKRLQKQ
jgi:hypothetical protein